MNSTGMNDRASWESGARALPAERSPEFLALVARIASTNKRPDDIEKWAADLAASVVGR